jgi:hypothetical protein
MSAAARRWRGIAGLLLAALAVSVLLGGLLPWAARNGYAGEVIRLNHEHDRDATGIFYTDAPGIWALVGNNPREALGSPQGGASRPAPAKQP